MNGMVDRSTSASGPVAHAARGAGGLARSIRSEARQYRWMVALAFPVMLVMAAIARLSGWRWQPWPPGPMGYRSIVTEAKEATVTYIGFAFASW